MADSGDSSGSSSGSQAAPLAMPLTFAQGFHHNRYQIKRDVIGIPNGELGVGSFGKVYLAIDKQAPRKMVAVKVERTDRCVREIFKKEKEFLRELRHENIVSLLDDTVCECSRWLRPVDRPIMLVMQHCEKGDLKTLLQETDGEGFPPLVVHSFFEQLAEGVDYMHACGIIHRDLKPSNVLLTFPPELAIVEGHRDERLFWLLKICDFGCAKKIDERPANASNTRTRTIKVMKM